jgi:uncharacterized OB-fold protein
MVDDIRLACPALLTQESGRYQLVGGRCRQCGETYFPARTGCTGCRATDFEAVVIGDRGRLWSWTVQGFLPKAPYNSGETEQSFRPYGVGYVEMPSGIKVESRLTVADPELLKIGMPMQLTLEPYRSTQEGIVHTYAFAPAEAEDNREHTA